MKSKDELIELIVKDANSFNEYIEENKDLGIDMSEIDLSNTEIKDVCFQNIDFTSSSFSDSHLFNVKFIECDLTSADLTRSTVTECEFSSSILNGTDFSYAVLDYCSFNDADTAGAIFNESDLSNSDLTMSLNLNACRFDDATIWPDNDMLPDDFDGMYSSDLSALQDEDDIEISDY